MNMRLLSVSFLLLLALITSSWLVSYVKMRNQSNNSQNVPSFATNVTVTNTDNDGHLANYFSTPEIIQDSQTNTTLLTKPQIILYSDNSAPRYVHADYGKSIGNDKITLWGNVVVYQKPNAKNQSASTLMTASLTFDMQKQYAETDQPVTIIQPDTVIHATGLKMNLKTGDTQLLSAIQVDHTPTKEAKGKTSSNAAFTF